jgi:hypothetical protein
MMSHRWCAGGGAGGGPGAARAQCACGRGGRGRTGAPCSSPAGRRGDAGQPHGVPPSLRRTLFSCRMLPFIAAIALFCHAACDPAALSCAQLPMPCSACSRWPSSLARLRPSSFVRACVWLILWKEPDLAAMWARSWRTRARSRSGCRPRRGACAMLRTTATWQRCAAACPAARYVGLLSLTLLFRHELACKRCPVHSCQYTTRS